MDTIKIILGILIVTQVLTLFVLKQKEKKLDKFRRLFETGKKISSNIKIKSLLQEIMEITKEETAAEASSLYLVDEEKQELWFEVALGEKGDQVKEIRLKMGEGVAGWVAQEAKPLNLEDVNKDPRFKREIGEKINFRQKAMLTIPVIFKDKTIGVLQLINKKGGGRFTKDDQELVEGMASQIAIALENANLYDDLRNLSIGVIKSLANAVDARDPYTNGHSLRVAEYSLAIGRKMGLQEVQLELLEYMAILHDVGKIGIRDEILNKSGPLTDAEYRIMTRHPQIGAEILSSVKLLQKIVPGVQHHHEKFDGSGYGMGLKGEEIPIEARIISVADTYDAMTTDRPYRKGLSHNIAMEELKKVAGKQLDPEVVTAFSLVMQEEQSG
jgi:putative nucleotidyltransferase with HDIG domain